MSASNFADRYARAGIAPGAAIIAARQAPVDRILSCLTNAQRLDLVGVYFGHPGLNLTWFRDEFLKEDASFSLINNERECLVLAASILAAEVAVGRAWQYWPYSPARPRESRNGGRLASRRG
jgi:hypothetical protein